MDVKTLSLGVLTRGAMSGYEIKKELEHGFRQIVSAGYGSIYPAFAELAAEGMVTVRSVEQDKRPDKKTYEITDSGLERLVANLMTTEPRHRVRSEFLVLMCFAHLLPASKVAAAIDSMIVEFERWLVEDIEGCARECAASGGADAPPGVRFALGYGRTVLGAGLDYLKSEKELLLRELEAGADRVPEAAE
jgi:PadR family transcriptional regulator, regulatory protein AphA